MACLKLTAPTLSLPGGLSIPTITTPPLDLGGVDFCCTYQIGNILPPVPIPLSAIVPGGVAALAAAVMLVAANALDAIQDEMQAALDLVQIPKCPIQD